MTSCGTFPEIARWWRQRQRTGCGVRAPEAEGGDGISRNIKSTNPRTLLLSVSRTEDGVAFIRERVRALRKELRGRDDPESRILLALYLEKLGEEHLENAFREINGALRTPSSGGDGWAESERARLGKTYNSFKVRRKALLGARKSGTLSPTAGRKRPRDCETPDCVSEGGVFGDGLAGEGWQGRPRKHEPGAVSEDDCLEAMSRFNCSATRLKPIDERNASTLSYEEFIETYALPGRPVVLKGGVSLCFEGGRAWGRESLMREAGGKMVPVRRWVYNSVSWARLEDAGQIPLAELLETLRPRACIGSDRLANPDDGVVGLVNNPEANPVGQRADGACSKVIDGKHLGRGDEATSCQGGGESVHRGSRPVGVVAERKGAGSLTGEGTGPEPLYLHDWSLPQNLGHESPLLVGRFQVPKFFAGDMLQRVAGRGLPYTDSWPSLFVGPRGSKSDAHIDSFGSHFWMALLQGKKRWVLYPKEDAPLLYPVWPEGCHDPVFEANLETTDAARHPTALLARGYQCVLEEGDVIFVPAGCPHRVENLTDTLALSCNYVDATNIEASLEALGDQALTDAGASALASALRACDPSLCRLQRDKPWANLQKRSRDEIADWLPTARVLD